jgi:hypothetical protein
MYITVGGDRWRKRMVWKREAVDCLTRGKRKERNTETGRRKHREWERAEGL